MHSGRSVPGAPLRRPFLRTPAIQALFIQISSFACVLALAAGMSALTEMQLTVALAAILQGMLAVLITRWCAMAWWWLLIQFVFPVALITLLAVALPPWIYLTAFMLLLGLYWTTFRTQVPYYPSMPATWRAVAALLPQGRTLRVIDIGSGFGGLVMHLAGRRANSEFVGIELAPLPWLVSQIRARLRGSSARFIRGDYASLHFADYDVVFAYLSPAAMPALWEKASAEMRQGALLMSYEFSIPDVIPDIVAHPLQDGPALYGWHIA